MSNVVTLPSGQVILYRSGKKPSTFARAWRQATAACGQHLDRVGYDQPRNSSRNLPNQSLISKLLLAPPKEAVLERSRILREFKTAPVFKLLMKNKWQRLCHFLYLSRGELPEKLSFRFPRERMLTSTLALSALVGSCASLSGNTNTHQVLVAGVEKASAAFKYTSSANTANWLTGSSELKGSKEAVMGAFSYAIEADYTFAASEADRDRLVGNGTLVKLEGTYIKLVDVSEPYVLPVVSQFVNRLGEQYAARGCGKLEVTGAFRNLEHQGTLSNGSSHSVHPTGMAVDLRRIVPENDEETFCLNWLQGTLTTIEKNRRIDVTAENHPRHFHVAVVTHDYERYLAVQAPKLDLDVKWLATALYFEAAFNESMEGYRAIGWAIRNRVRSKEFPNTIVEVVAQGAAGRNTGGCQFSFMCDGKAEHIQTLCAQPNTVMSQYWLGKCDERWEVVVKIAKQILTETNDPTGGAVLYYAASLDKAPYWTQKRIEQRKGLHGKMIAVVLQNGDFIPGTIKRLGNHVFGCSHFAGNDVCTTNKGV